MTDMQSNPTFVVTQDNEQIDQKNLIAVLTAFALSLLIISVPIRMYVRGSLKRYGFDDLFYFIAVILAVCQSSVVFLAISKGLGQINAHLNVDTYTSLLKALFAADILYVVPLGFSKTSTACLFLRLTPVRGHVRAVQCTIALCISWMMCTILISGVRCHTQGPWQDISFAHCPDLFARQQAITALDVTTEVLLFGISLYMVWHVRVSLAAKALVVSAFGLRLPIIALSLLRLHYLVPVQRTLSIDPVIALVPSICCAQLNIGYSILASIVPCLKNFVSAFEKPITSVNSYALRTPNSKKRSQATSTTLSNQQGTQASDLSWNCIGEEQSRTADSPTYPSSPTSTSKLRPDRTTYETIITGRSGIQLRGGGLDGINQDEDSDTRRIVIQRGVEWSVDFDRASRVTRSPSPHGSSMIGASRVEEGGVLL